MLLRTSAGLVSSFGAVLLGRRARIVSASPVVVKVIPHILASSLTPLPILKIVKTLRPSSVIHLVPSVR